MSNVRQITDRRDPTADACEWLARLERGLTEVEDRKLHDWLAANPKHTTALIEAAELWDRMDTLSRLADLFPKPTSRPAHRGPLILAIAASALIIAVGILFVMVPGSGLSGLSRLSPDFGSSVSGYAQQFETAIGEHSTVRLPDGSEITLNTNSRVRAEFDQDKRTLRLERGEMFVHVAHDETRPLTVWAGDKLVRAVGTSFNVEITNDQQVEVIVTEGKVLIGVVNIDAPAPDNAWLEQFATPVAAGELVLISQQPRAVKEIGADEIDVKLSWRAGNLIFHGEPLAQALDEVERYTSVTFVIRDEELKAIRVAGLFKAGDVDGLLKTLRENFNISYERVDAQKIVLKSE
jgi:transmembrane sensor